MKSVRWALIPFAGVLIKKNKFEHRHVGTQSKDHEKEAIFKPRKVVLEETNPTSTLILDF